MLRGPRSSTNLRTKHCTFKRFRQFRSNINQIQYKPLDDTTLDNLMMFRLRQAILSVDRSYDCLEKEGHREMIELICLLALGADCQWISSLISGCLVQTRGPDG